MTGTAVDLRSDTVTQPSPQMRQAMADAIVGDDVFGEDPTILALQETAARLAGLESGLYVPSGTMANQIAILTHCRPGDDVLVGAGAHIMLYESGAAAAIGGVQFSILGEGGHFTAEDVSANVKHNDASGHVPPSTLLAVENTHNRGGGLVMAPETFEDIATEARKSGVRVHLDGARLFNAAIASGVGADAWGRHCDTVSICLSKGLGAPVGSVLCGDRETIKRAHRFRKMLGGGMRQAGMIAAGGLHALNHHIEGLRDDHRRARKCADVLSGLKSVQLDPQTVRTNIVIFGMNHDAAQVVAALNDRVRVIPLAQSESELYFIGTSMIHN